MGAKIDLGDYNAVVSDIYESALSPAHWDVALTNMVHRFGHDRWDVAMLVWERVSPPAGRFVGASGVHEMARAGYVHMFAGQNEWSRCGHDLPVGTVVHSDQLLTRDAFKDGQFYQQYLVNYNMEVAIIASLDRHGPDHLGLCLPGPDNGSVAVLKKAVAMLLPHIQRSCRISRRIGEAELAAANARAVLDRAPSSILMCDAAMRLTYANGHGEALIDSGALPVRDGKLMLAREDAARLQSLIKSESSARCLTLVLETESGPPVTAMAMRVDNGGANAEFGEAPIMIVAGLNHRAAEGHIDSLRGWFDLTPSEARLAATLAEGGSLEDYAQSRGVSANAARFLLKGVFSKTDTRRQAQLVAKLRSTPVAWQSGSMNGLPAPLS